MKVVKLLLVVFAVFFLMVSPVFAENVGPSTSVFSGAGLGGGLGMALTIIGAGYGFGRIGSAAMDGMSRQPEVAPRIQTAMIIIAAMLEGATLASVLFCFLVGYKAAW